MVFHLLAGLLLGHENWINTKRIIMGLEKFCQSCMMPKDSDIFQAGTEKNGILENNIYQKIKTECCSMSKSNFRNARF